MSETYRSESYVNLNGGEIRSSESIILSCDGSTKVDNNSSKITTAKWDGWVYCKFLFYFDEIYHNQLTTFSLKHLFYFSGKCYPSCFTRGRSPGHCPGHHTQTE